MKNKTSRMKKKKKLEDFCPRIFVFSILFGAGKCVLLLECIVLTVLHFYMYECSKHLG